MWFSKRFFLFAALTALTACGFTPVYGPGGAGKTLNGAILVSEPTDRNAFIFVGRLEERLGQPQSARFALDYKITTSTTGVGITPEQETTRYNLFGTIDYSIIERATDTVVNTGTVDNFTGYSATSLIVGTQSVTRDANQRLMVILADQIVAKLIATAPDWLQ
jgi:LPS-assembly lipoprotein